MHNTKPKILSLAARRYALVVLAIVYMFNFVDRQILAILLPQIRDEFGTSDAYLGFLSGTAFALFYVTLGIPIAQYADRCNRRNLIAAAVALWSAMTAVSGLAANIWQLTAARIGVGIGEAGCSPPAHSMIADYFPPEKRSTAMGFYTLGISAGIMIAYLAGGWVAQNIGWRAAFLVVGIPGLLLALIVRFTMKEPQRGESEDRSASGRRASVGEVIRFLKSRRSFIHMAIGAGLTSFVGYSVISFLPSFMVRSFDMEIATLGVWLGLILGISGGAGFFFGGYYADHLGQSSHRRAFNFISLTILVSAGLMALMFLAETSNRALWLFILPAATSNVYLAPVLSQAQSLVALRMRATTSALVLLIINVIGLALGPPLTGLLSDALEPRFGVESMRYSLLVVSSLVLPWAVWHFYRAGKWIDADLARVDGVLDGS
jgi:predicted MFS family arabinose efflux permease